MDRRCLGCVKGRSVGASSCVPFERSSFFSSRSAGLSCLDERGATDRNLLRSTRARELEGRRARSRELGDLIQPLAVGATALVALTRAAAPFDHSEVGLGGAAPASFTFAPCLGVQARELKLEPGLAQG